ncbi:MAG TPA: GNAT family N-acetyltransferase [Armatimonadota bacterium]|jgi:predicted dehydrogenase/GNAT superfamily N-acetyltransferase
MAAEGIRVGVVGAAGRGGGFKEALQTNGAVVTAVCDVREDRLEQSRRWLGADHQFFDFGEMLEGCDLEAVVIATPMPLHVPQSVEALKRGIHVLCEVPAAVSVEECRELARACQGSSAVYMMAENYTYTRPNVLVRELASRGLFGDVYYAEGEYLHELKQLNEDTPWRRRWQTGIEGITYGTHSLGPILQWMPGDRVTRVSCEGSGHHYKDPRGEEYHQDTAVMLCKTARGALIKIRVDMLSDRPHAMANYQLQGTDGVYESSRGGPGDRDRIWLRELSQDIRWHDLDSLMGLDALAQRYQPEIWRNPPPEALRAGHGGGDFFEVLDFTRAIRDEAHCPIGIHEALDITLPGLVSQQSALRGGAWLEVPDSRTWAAEEPARPQLQMVWPRELLSRPPEVSLPEAYELRQYCPADEEAYIRLMDGAGFGGWDHDRVSDCLRMMVPGGFFVVEHRPTGALVATAMAKHGATEQHPFGGELSWVAGDPEHGGKGLGRAVCAAVTRRFLQAGYQEVYLLTDDFRLPAIAVYLRLGYQPLMYADGMYERWDALRSALSVR